MSQIVKINKTDLQVVEYRGQRVVTLAQVDDVHERPEGTARRNFNKHRARFRAGLDFFEVDQPDEIRSLGIERPQGGTPNKVVLVTEQGYTMLVKPFSDDLAWDVQRQLVTGYFRKAAELTVKDPQIAAVIFALQRVDAVEQEQKRQAEDLARLQENVAVIEARTQPENKHFTVLGWANLIGVPVDVKTAAGLGRRCASLSRERGLVIGDVRDPRFGAVHSYHESVLQDVLPAKLQAAA